jgi:hypothetical protein
MKVYTIEAFKGANKCTEKKFEDLAVWFEEAEPGEVYTIEVGEMTEDEYNKLPEFTGP